jgi:hypothetical protein
LVPASVRSALQVLLGSALALAAAGGVAAAPNCPRAPAPAALLERFTPADCEACWQAPQDPPASQARRVMVLDWIVPAADGAPLAAAALPEASERAGGLAANQTLLRQTPLARAGALRLRIADGPAWNGYIGLQLTVRRVGKLPADAVAYAALVERVPAGSEGTPVARQLVRALVGPLSLQELVAQTTIHHLRAVRIPEGSRGDRLGSVAWVADANGKVIAATQSPTSECAAP